MEGRISLSEKELSRLNEIKKVLEKRQMLSQAANNLSLCKRRVLRIY